MDPIIGTIRNKTIFFRKYLFKKPNMKGIFIGTNNGSNISTY